jgi:copper(I)-binding protein
LKIFKTIFFIIFTLAILTGCNHKDSIDIQAPWARPALSGNNSAAYFMIANNSSENDALIDAQSSIAEFTQIHMSIMKDGNMMMQEQEEVEIPANSSVEFKPKGLHIMLINLNNELKTGDEFELKLVFEKSGEKIVIVTIKEP